MNTDEIAALKGRIVELEHDLIMSRDHAKHLVKDLAYWKSNSELSDAELCRLENALIGARGLPFADKNGPVDVGAKCMERIRDLIAAEGELGDLKEKLKQSNP